MLIGLFCGLLILYFLVIFIDLILLFIRCFSKKRQSNCLSISKPTHYFCSVVTLIIIGALFLNLFDFDMSFWWFYVIFGFAVLLSIPLMLVVVFWKVTWTKETIQTRNLFCVRKSYDIENIHLINKRQYTTIMYKGKKVTDYNFMLLNIWDVRKFETFIKTHPNSADSNSTQK